MMNEAHRVREMGCRKKVDGRIERSIKQKRPTHVKGTFARPVRDGRGNNGGEGRGESQTRRVERPREGDEKRGVRREM